MSFLQKLCDYFVPPIAVASPSSPEDVKTIPKKHTVWCQNPKGLHRMAYTEWGDRDNPQVVVCVHGLTRNGRDFDELAQALSTNYRVICPDVVGRGQSDWLPDPQGYAFPQYVADMVTLIARLDVESVFWLGTSMGGLIGMFLASLPHSPIQRLIMNDVGPLVTGNAIRRIAQYVGQMPEWASLAEAEAVLRVNFAPFGKLSDAQWQHLTQHSVRQNPNGTWQLAYDPGIAEAFRQAFAANDVNLWPIYDQIRCPTLAIRGAESDLLSRPIWEEMGRHGPRAQLIEVPDVGHAPCFMNAGQISLVQTFFAKW